MDNHVAVFELVMAVVVLGGFLLLIMALMSGKKAHLDRQFYNVQWQKLLGYLPTGEAGWRLAIIDADKLLDHALKARGYKGATMADRMRSAKKSFSRYNDLWASHKLRNRLVHEPNVALGKDLTQRSLQEFRRALKELGALS